MNEEMNLLSLLTLILFILSAVLLLTSIALYLSLGDNQLYSVATATAGAGSAFVGIILVCLDKRNKK